MNSDYEIWKGFVGRISLPYLLRILTGLSRSHEKIQEKIGESCSPLFHKLEQFSSGATRVGVLSEDLLLALKDNPKVASAIEEVQAQTKNEKKHLIGYSTVTHFNIVHIDCHSNAIRLSCSNRDE